MYLLGSWTMRRFATYLLSLYTPMTCHAHQPAIHGAGGTRAPRSRSPSLPFALMRLSRASGSLRGVHKEAERTDARGVHVLLDVSLLSAFAGTGA